MFCICAISKRIIEDDIKNYFESLIPEVEEHFYPEIGGFSYYKHKSQTHYYGLNISDGLDEPDLRYNTFGLGFIDDV